MTTNSSQAAVAAYLHAMMRSFSPASKPGQKIAEWLRHNQHLLGIDYAAETRAPAPSGGQRIRLPELEILLPEQWRALAEAIAPARLSTGAVTDPVGENIAALAAALELDRESAEVLRFVLETDRNKAFEWLCSTILSTRVVDSLGLIAAAIGIDPSAVWDALSSGPLGRLQIVKTAGNNGEDFACYVPPRITQALLPPNQGLRDIERHLIGRTMPPTLELADFSHVARETDFLKRLLGNAAAQRRRGVNVLLHGIPGTGKTELCKTIAAKLGFALFAVGEVDDWGGEPTRDERLEALLLADRLAARRGRVLLLFDEMQDLLFRDEETGGFRRRRKIGSKVFMNRLLEQNRVPILWASNEIEAFDPAFIRRMSYVLEMKPLPLGARTRMIAKAGARSGIAIGPERAAEIARRYRTAPGVVSSAIEAVTTAGGNVEEVVFAADALARSVEGLTPAVPARIAPFVPELANADLDLAALERRLTQPAAPCDFSLLLYGPPGTGKSAFTRHLAEAVDLDPLFRRASDLLSKWVGETEKRLADAFAEAKEERRFLIIDEVEPFLWSRSGASRSWEVSMVDEFLVQMENHPLPLACTSNLLDAIDPAAVRRFTFKVKFDFLTAAQVEQAYRHFFRRATPPGLRELTCLTPSDFAAVIKQSRLLAADEIDDAHLVAMLEREVAVKQGPSRRIGF